MDTIWSNAWAQYEFLHDRLCLWSLHLPLLSPKCFCGPESMKPFHIYAYEANAIIGVSQLFANAVKHASALILFSRIALVMGIWNTKHRWTSYRSLAMILSPIAMVLGCYLAITAHLEAEQNMPGVFDDFRDDFIGVKGQNSTQQPIMTFLVQRMYHVVECTLHDKCRSSNNMQSCNANSPQTVRTLE